MRRKVDHCTLWPDGNYGKCCERHDKAYFKGGTQCDRLAADRSLRECVRMKGHPWIAQIMYIGVRLFGAPWFPSPYRWGKGRDYKCSWKYDRS